MAILHFPADDRAAAWEDAIGAFGEERHAILGIDEG